MRCRLSKSSQTRYLLIADSQGKEFDIVYFNVLSLPGACIRHEYNFISKTNYDTAFLLIGGNNLMMIHCCKLMAKVHLKVEVLVEIKNVGNFILFFSAHI